MSVGKQIATILWLNELAWDWLGDPIQQMLVEGSSEQIIVGNNKDPLS